MKAIRVAGTGENEKWYLEVTDEAVTGTASSCRSWSIGVLLVPAGETLILSLKASFVNDKWSLRVW